MMWACFSGQRGLHRLHRGFEIVYQRSNVKNDGFMIRLRHISKEFGHEPIRSRELLERFSLAASGDGQVQRCLVWIANAAHHARAPSHVEWMGL